MERVVKLVKEARYDICVLTGDYRGSNLWSVRHKRCPEEFFGGDSRAVGHHQQHQQL